MRACVRLSYLRGVREWGGLLFHVQFYLSHFSLSPLLRIGEEKTTFVQGRGLKYFFPLYFWKVLLFSDPPKQIKTLYPKKHSTLRCFDECQVKVLFFPLYTDHITLPGLFSEGH